jgi:anthranilate synthase/aminodeoxychorismate synthase-like glutamine amidotransferase
MNDKSVNRILVIDNYDSFTYNLSQALQVLGAEVQVIRNDKITVSEAKDMELTHLVISPGPGRPEDAGVSMDMIAAFAEQMPVLGVCLGHQSIAQLYGGQVTQAQRLMHGKDSPVYHDSTTLYLGLPNPFQAGRYHSLSVPESGVPQDFSVSAYTSDGEVMGIRHKHLPLEGVQFHPESILTPEGDRLLQNFLALEAPCEI